jgi:hypothetical protein
MALITQRDQIVFGIIAQRTARHHVVNLEIAQKTTELTTPSVSPQNL